MERRLLLASFLTLIVIYAYQLLFTKAPDPNTTAAAKQAAPSASGLAAPSQPTEDQSPATTTSAQATVSEIGRAHV